METVPVVAGCIVKDRKVLLAKRLKGESPETIGMWEMPGGRVEDSETLSGALGRELEEELGLVVYVKELLHAQINRYSSGIRYLVLFYHCEVLAERPGSSKTETVWVYPNDPLFSEALPGAEEAVNELICRGGFR